MTNEAVALDTDFHEYCVLVAVGRGGDEAQAISAGLALCPELIASAAVEGYIAAAQGKVEGLAIHEPHHEHIAVVGILHDGGCETLHLVEVDLSHLFSSGNLGPAVSQRGETRSPLCSIASAGQELWMITCCLSAGLRRHDRRVMVMVAMAQGSLHNVLIIGACDKSCQSEIDDSTQNFLHSDQSASGIIYKSVTSNKETYVFFQ